MLRNDKVAVGFGCGWLLTALAGIAFWIAAIYIVLHFVAKFW